MQNISCKRILVCKTSWRNLLSAIQSVQKRAGDFQMEVETIPSSAIVPWIPVLCRGWDWMMSTISSLTFYDLKLGKALLNDYNNKANYKLSFQQALLLLFFHLDFAMDQEVGRFRWSISAPSPTTTTKKEYQIWEEIYRNKIFHHELISNRSQNWK